MYKERQDDRYGGRYHKKTTTESKGGYLEEYHFFDWEPVKLFEKWFYMLMSAFARKTTKQPKKQNKQSKKKKKKKTSTFGAWF